MPWGRKHALLLPHPHPLVFEVGKSLVWASIDEGIHLSEKIPDSDVDYPTDC